MRTKKRLDIILFERGLVRSRQKAKALILEGKVRVNDKKIEKAGTLVDVNSIIKISKKEYQYVSRGGKKLEKALDEFKIDIKGKKILDVGVSTGGFTDCLLRKGAENVIAVDVGYGQIALKLRKNPKVILMERTNIRYLDIKDLPFLVDMVTIDLSFISVKKVMENILRLSKDNAEYLVLIKPQFEVGKGLVGKGGIVKDKNLHKNVILDIMNFFKNLELTIKGITFSPIKGADGNIEFWIYAMKGLTKKEIIETSFLKNIDDKIESVIIDAHKSLNK
jgi:23S rRNA (cytidine1920-2'-O)/16S rRNA (cytidine1409-2'-O)-methyltransferase